MAIQTIYIQSLVSIYMFLLHLLSYRVWDIEIQEMVSHLKSNLLSFSTCVSQVSVSDTQVNVFSDQTRLLQGKSNVSSTPGWTHLLINSLQILLKDMHGIFITGILHQIWQAAIYIGSPSSVPLT